jgi:hypothetical protein
MTDATGTTSAIVRYVVPCTDKRVIAVVRDALTGWPATHNGSPLIGLEVAPLAAPGNLLPGGDWAYAGLFWDARQTTGLYADGARFHIQLGSRSYAYALSEIPVPSWAHVLRIPMVKPPVAGHPESVTFERTSYGPYVGLPVHPRASAYNDYLFSRSTVEDIINDLDAGAADVTGQWEGELLRFEWTEEGVEGRCQQLVLPDEHNRYPIGGIWAWTPWDDQAPQRETQRAYALGATEYTSTVTTHVGEDLIEDYDRGREEANRLTLRRNEP